MNTPQPLPLSRLSVEPTDTQLVARVLDGDTDAYAGLVQRHQDAIYRHARGLGLDHDASVDVVQDALVKAYDHLSDCRDGANYRAWLFRICRNLCFDELRNVRRRLTTPMSQLEFPEQIADPGPMPDETTMTLRAALDQVPPAMRDAFLLKHDAGYTYEEIAVMTAASPSAVKMRVHRAREVLRAFLVKQGFRAHDIEEDPCDDRDVARRLTPEHGMERQARIAPSTGAPATRIRRMS